MNGCPLPRNGKRSTTRLACLSVCPRQCPTVDASVGLFTFRGFRNLGKDEVSALLSHRQIHHFWGVLWERDYMKRRPDADGAVESEPSRPTFNLFTGLSGTPLASGTSASNPASDKQADREGQTEKVPQASSETPDHSTKKRRMLLIVLAVLLAGALIAMSLL